jgi:UDP-hydrolysing UDP-N-acetyl-D-glucosamine 2-epimerase
MKKICVITGTRAEYGLLKPIMSAIQKSPELELQVIATTMHMAHNFGETYKQIESDGFVIDEKIENLIASDTGTAIAKSSGLVMILLSDVLHRLSPDAILVLGDRYETFSAATTAVLLKIPVVHIHGGERTEGAIDEQLRHALTKLSFLHFTSTNEYRQRIIQMGEDSSRVICSGAPGIDTIVQTTFFTLEELSIQLNWKIPFEYSLVIYHPETYADTNVYDDISLLLKTLKEKNRPVIFVYANADHGGQTINHEVEKFVAKDISNFHVVKNLSMQAYLSLLKHAQVLIGNSSSGIIEAPSLGTAVINIGDRQKGRLRAGNVLDCTLDSLNNTIDTALSVEFQKMCTQVKNPYGEGNATQIIIDTLVNTELQTKKVFVDEE